MSAWTTLSDRNAKTAVRPIDAREVLKKVTALPLNTWQYKAQDAKYRHMGPMAQDFYAAFRLGESDTGIDTVDADGVALAAIQGLNAELAERDRKIATLSSQMDALAKSKNAEIAAIRGELSAQTKRVAALESLAGDVASLKKQLAASHQPATTTVALAHP
jgi:capsule polysaccharide export protein KpsE/RkpR